MFCRPCNRAMTYQTGGAFTCPTPGCESAYTPDPETFALIDAALERVGGEYMAECIGVLTQALACADDADWCPDPEWALDGLDLPETVGYADLLAWNEWQLEQIDNRDRYAA